MRGWKRVAEQVIAGILIPAMACSAYGLIASRDILGGLLFGAFFGTLLGAPICIPVLIVINLRRTWLAVPILTAAAAIGVALQIALLGAMGPVRAEVAAVLDSFWIVPAVVGALTAWTLKTWESRHEPYH
jgi:hypothetical protein